ncbi:hypothetical protein ACFSBG_04685 [Georgenia yuyongxinii]|uniref:hypothetical protein n=1 Tax=Georgenia yuyongxinii TaxID=2589797 RepID=UPI0015D387B0|nr:hypothetical protein [Georgenia yuyongxinii]
MTADRRLTGSAVRQLTLPTEPWLSCEDCFDRMDRFVEAVLERPRTTAFPDMRLHLAGCPACAEEAESLLVLVAEEDGVDPTVARAGLLQQSP